MPCLRMLCLLCGVLFPATLLANSAPHPESRVVLGVRPGFLVDSLPEGDLKQRLQACENRSFSKRHFSIGHRGAALMFPEHTRESYIAAARQGAGVIECDVTFTRDRQLVCRHDQCDLHYTTNILQLPELAARCTEPFTPATTEKNASARCCTSDLLLSEFKQLEGKMEGANLRAKTPGEYVNATPAWRTELYAARGTLMTHAESIELFKQLGVDMTPELKSPLVPMPFEGDFTQRQFARSLIDEYVDAGVPPSQVWPQSFEIQDVLFWIERFPDFGRQAVLLDGRDASGGFDHRQPERWTERQPQELIKKGINIIAPPIWMLVEVDATGRIVPSSYAHRARDAGLDIITWTLERSGTLHDGGGWYFQTLNGLNPLSAAHPRAITRDGDVYSVLDVLARDIGVRGVFSDWPATVTYYANCMNLD